MRHGADSITQTDGTGVGASSSSSSSSSRANGQGSRSPVPSDGVHRSKSTAAVVGRMADTAGQRSITHVGRSASTAALSPTPSPPRTGASGGNGHLAHYTLGDCLGRGAFGSVFRGLNWMTGETVAVKQIQLGNIPKSELGEIMSEIDLLKNLNHANIVKYKGSEKTKDYLYIILEYCENGSLHGILRRFGKFPEGLVGVYISQVLDGLLYLHEQGVIHRDIKGANILTNKDGSVKLADFGVATKTGAMNDYAVVGSPYWMAPEVIDQSGATTASDIWSVGCVVVELLEGKPPYHFLAPMPALFRIVQDDYPPMPEGASPIVKDFLLHCFQKDVNLRVSARKLLKHPWMVAARRQLDQMKSGGSLRAAGTTAGATVHDEAVKSVREWNEALQEPMVGHQSNHGGGGFNNAAGSTGSSPNPNQHLGKGGSPRINDAATVRPPAHNKLRRVSAMAPVGHSQDGATARPGLLKPKAGMRPTLPADFGVQDSEPSPAVAAARKPLELNTAAAAAAREPPSSPTTKLPLAGAAPAPSLMDQRSKLVDLQRPEEDTDNWDDDFEEGITTTKIAALERSAPIDDGHARKRDDAPGAAPERSTAAAGGDDRRGGAHADYDQQTIRPSPLLRSVSSLPQVGAPRQQPPASASTPLPPPSPSASDSSKPDGGSSVEDYSDLIEEADESHLNARIQNLKLQNSVGKRLFHPDDLKRLSRPEDERWALGLTTDEAGPPHLRSEASPQSTTVIRPISPTASRANSLRAGKDDKWKEMRQALGKYAEEGGDEDYSDVFGKAFSGALGGRLSLPDPQGPLQLTTRLSQRSWLGDDRDDEDDPFAEIDEDLDAEADMEANVARDKHARMCTYVSDLVDSLSPDAPDRELLRACEQIDEVLTDMPEMKMQLLGCHGALALIQLLEIATETELVTRLLGILNLIIFDDPEAQENLCLIGAIPVVINFTTKKWSHELRLEAAHFVFAMCSTSRLTLQFVLSCRGLRTLVDLIDEDYADRKDLVWIGVGCVSSVLELQSPASRTDFCRMLAQDGLLEPLSTALLSVVRDAEDPYAQQAQAHILQTFLIFSQSDGWLKKSLATRSVLRKLLQATQMLGPEPLIQMLKILKNLTMNPATLDEIQNANTIEILVRILAEHHGGAHGTEMSNQVLNAMYNLCRLSKSRQEEAAESGIIPQLLRVAQTKSPLKQFALPILCDLAHTGKGTRQLLWQHRALHFYVGLLEDPYWQVSALDSIHVWLQDETHRVEEVLLQPSSVDSLLCLFATSKANSFENLLEPYLKICRLSTAITIAMGKNSAFLRKLVDRLKHPKAVVRLNLLRLTKMVCDVHPDRGTLIQQFSLYEIIDQLSKHDGAVLVRELARDILSQRYMQAEPRTVRRTMSDVGSSTIGSSSPAVQPIPDQRPGATGLGGLNGGAEVPARVRPGRRPQQQLEDHQHQVQAAPQQRRSPSVQQGGFALDHGSPRARRRLPLPEILDADAWKQLSSSSAPDGQENDRQGLAAGQRRAALRDRSVSPNIGAATGVGAGRVGPRSLIETFSPPSPLPQQQQHQQGATTVTASSDQAESRPHGGRPATSPTATSRVPAAGAGIGSGGGTGLGLGVQGRVLSPRPLSSAADVLNREDQDKTMRPMSRPPSRRPIPSLPTAGRITTTDTGTVRSRTVSSSSNSSSSSSSGTGMGAGGGRFAQQRP
ncbi:related to MAPKK kinase [Pseudozyma flocculosa]|nr:related to MAPKK kinase [Pseudozyma flocculosa]